MAGMMCRYQEQELFTAISELCFPCLRWKTCCHFNIRYYCVAMDFLVDPTNDVYSLYCGGKNDLHKTNAENIFLLATEYTSDGGT